MNMTKGENMFTEFVLSLFTKKESSKVLTIVQEKRNIKDIKAVEIKKEKKPLRKTTSLTNYFINIQSLYIGSDDKIILDKRKASLQL